MFTKYLMVGLLALVIGAAEASGEVSPSVIDLASIMEMESLIEKISDRQVIFVGETHDRYEHHLNQLAIIKGQHARHKELAIGLEFFQRPFQSVLDDFIAGRIEEEDFLRKSEYFERWSYDYRLYRPIFQYAREHEIPLLALNTEREITDQVKKAGIESLSDEQKARIPQEIDRSDQVYRSRLEEIFKQHPHAKEADFERFLDVQLLWDEGMASRAADWLKQHPQGHLVVLAGVGHMIYGSGIPNRLQRRTPVSSAIVINARNGSGIDSKMGDYLIMTGDKALPPSGKLGVFLDTKESPPTVTGFVKQSGAKTAGVKEGDSILRIDNKAVESYTDIRIALMDKTVGEHVTVKVERDVMVLGSMVYDIEVELK